MIITIKDTIIATKIFGRKYTIPNNNIFNPIE